MSELSVKMTGDEAQLFAALQKVISANAQATQGFTATSQASQGAGRAAKETAREMATTAAIGTRLAQSLRKENETLSDTYARQKKELEAAHTAGKLSAEELKTATAQLTARYHENVRATEAAAEAQRRAAEEASEAFQRQSRMAADGVRAVQRLEAAAKTLDQRYEELKMSIHTAFMQGKISADQYRNSMQALDNELKTHNETQKEAFGTRATQNLVNMAAGYLSLQGAISAARYALQQYREERDRGKAETERLADARSSLFQISSTSDEFNALESRADRAAVDFGLDRDEARRVLFSARSEGFEDDYEEVVSLKPVIAPEAAATVAGQVRALFKNEGLSVTEAVGGVLAGARESRLNFEEITQALPSVAEGGSQQGASFDESVGALSVLASTFKSGQAAGDRLKALMTKMSLNEATTGQGLIGGVKTLQNMSPEDRKAFLGESIELNSAFNAVVASMGEIEQRSETIKGARENAGDLLGVARNHQKTMALQRARGAKAAQQLAEEDAFATGALSNEQALSEIQARQIDTGESLVTRTATNATFGALDYLGFDIQKMVMAGVQETLKLDASVRNSPEMASLAIGRKFLDGEGAFGEKPNEQTDLLKKMNDNLERMAGERMVTRPGEDR